MNQKPVEAIIFDVGGTLRTTEKRAPEEKPAYIQKICDLLGSNQPPEHMLALLEQRALAHKEWSAQTQTGLCEADFWSLWMLPDWPSAEVRRLAIPLNQAWREASGVRKVLPEVQPLMIELFRRGYRLGIASNTITSTEVPQMLKDLGLAGYFECAVLSCRVHARKPQPDLLLTAAAQMRIAPERCVYVGNRADLDVPAARGAGFGQVILVGYEAEAGDGPLPDRWISSLNELLELFPAHKSGNAPAPSSEEPPAPVRASLSSMWGMKNFAHLSDFFEAARRLGLATIELNHQVTPQMLIGLEMPVGRVRSVHEPCPAQPSMRILTERDWLISATDEENRAAGVAAVKQSIDLAARLQAGVVVVHAGNVLSDHSLEKKLKALYPLDESRSVEADALRGEMLEMRRRLAPAHLAAVQRSLMELLAYARSRGVCLGLENRFHWMDIPTPDEMAELLVLDEPQHLGFILDTGHAFVMDRLGFYPAEGWLARFGARLVGTHLHDVRGLTDHYAPGLGEINFDAILPCLPPEAFRTLELAPFNTFAEVRAGIEFLKSKGAFVA